MFFFFTYFYWLRCKLLCLKQKSHFLLVSIVSNITSLYCFLKRICFDFIFYRRVKPSFKGTKFRVDFWQTRILILSMSIFRLTFKSGLCRAFHTSINRKYVYCIYLSCKSDLWSLDSLRLCDFCRVSFIFHIK